MPLIAAPLLFAPHTPYAWDGHNRGLEGLLCCRKPFLPMPPPAIPIPQATGRKRRWKKRRYSGS